MNNGINVLSLFDGISCGQIALQRAGITVNQYFASEIEKNAIKVTQYNWLNTIQLGDVTKVVGTDLPKIDLLTGGFCCQSFSFAGRQLNFNDPRGKLFFECVRLLEECKPKYFLFENVRMKQEYQDIISEKLGVQPILINSSLVSAQNRVRLYWTNIPNVQAPIDRGILLKDIIQEDYDGIWVWPRGGNPGGIQGYNNKSPSLTTSSWQHNFKIYQKHNITGVAVRGRVKDSSSNTWIQMPCYNAQGKAHCLLASFYHKGSSLYHGGRIRKFTPNEAEALQTVPLDYTSILSDNQRFKCLGNGWTVDVIAHILSFIPRENFVNS